MPDPISPVPEALEALREVMDEVSHFMSPSLAAKCRRVLAAAPAAPEGRKRAIAIVEDSRRTHVEWVDYLDQWGGDLRPMEEVAGDIDHHREAVANYDHVLEVLRSPAPAAAVDPPPAQQLSEALAENEAMKETLRAMSARGCEWVSESCINQWPEPGDWCDPCAASVCLAALSTGGETP